MFRYACTLLAALSAIPASAGERPDAVLIRYPDVSQTHIAFRYDGDIWLVAKEGGEARRITTTEGNESFPRFSPDGQRLALQASYDGGGDIYVLGLDGALPQRITWHPGGETLSDWHPNGKDLIFWSSRNAGISRAPEMFTISAAGGAPTKLPIPYGTFGAIDDSGTWLAYTPRTREFRTWKRYQGGMAQDIWLYNLKTNEWKQVTDHPGTDAVPMWHGDKLLFISDRGESHRLNLYEYSLEDGSTRQLTNFSDWDVKFPAIGPADVVFENGGKLFRYELASGTTVEVDLVIPGDRKALRAQEQDVSKLLQGADISPNAKRVVVAARGEIFSVPVEKGFTRNLTQTSGVGERFPTWSPDGRWIAYFADATGEYELYVQRSDGRAFNWNGDVEEVHKKRLTALGAGWKNSPLWAPNSEMIAFQDNEGALKVLTLESGDVQTVDISSMGHGGVSWSADGSWLTWSRSTEDSLNSSIFLHEIATGTTTKVTSDLFSENAPVFDRNGDWLYYTSNRSFAPTYSDFDDTWIYANSTNLVAVPLRADVENPWAVENEEEEIEDEEAEEEGAESADDSESSDADDASAEDGEEEAESEEEEADEQEPSLAIELDGFESRAIFLPVASGRMGGLTGADGKIIFVRLPRTGSSGEAPKLVYYDIEKKKEETILSGVGGYALAAKADKLLVNAGGSWAVVSLAPGQKADKKIPTAGLVAEIAPREEWRQIMHDCWRLVRDIFYDSNLHHVDWERVRDRYVERALEGATSREDVHYLIGEMIGELNVGHAYNSPPRSGMQSAPNGRSAGLLGCDWTLDRGTWQITRIIGGADYDYDARGPLQALGVDVREGDYLLEVNGTPVDGSREVYAAFLGTADKPTELCVNTEPKLDGNERRVLVKPIRSDRGLRYRRWVVDKRERVTELSDGRIGYIHVPDTGRNGQNELVRQYSGQAQMDALLVDERWNGGGQVPTRFIELLNRPTTNYWAIRNEELAWPIGAHQGPKAMLINESAGSGGDAFPFYFRQAGLGKLIGTRTWGGLVGIGGTPAFIDGSRVSIPSFAFYDKDGTWGIEGYGVAPDIEVVDDPSKMLDGGDPQLEAGVKQLLDELKSYDAGVPPRPASPDRRGAGITEEDR